MATIMLTQRDLPGLLPALAGFPWTVATTEQTMELTCPDAQAEHVQNALANLQRHIPPVLRNDPDQVVCPFCGDTKIAVIQSLTAVAPLRRTAHGYRMLRSRIEPESVEPETDGTALLLTCSTGPHLWYGQVTIIG